LSKTLKAFLFVFFGLVLRLPNFMVCGCGTGCSYAAAFCRVRGAAKMPHRAAPWAQRLPLLHLFVLHTHRNGALESPETLVKPLSFC
jgi:hypothetical protein